MTIGIQGIVCVMSGEARVRIRKAPKLGGRETRFTITMKTINARQLASI
ncbi:MAG: hypothetical protein ACREDR_29190 [Blastocatellia bacterium]